MDNFSIIIPIYNEEQILRDQITNITKKIKRLRLRQKYEIILVENGSHDNTYQIAKELKNTYKNIRVIKLIRPSYGQAFRAGIKKSRYPIIVQFDLDFWDIRFLKKSLGIMNEFDIVIGSKNLSKSTDKRFFTRRIISKCIEKSIKLRFNTTLSDSHGLKVIRKEVILPLLDYINCTNHFFDTELLLTSCTQGAQLVELPVELTEIRKTRFPYLVRTIEVIHEYIGLMIYGLPTTSQVKPGLALQRS